MRELHFFDPSGEVGVLERSLPHWSQSGVVCFISFRTFDSMPSSEIDGFTQIGVTGFVAIASILTSRIGGASWKN